MIPISICIIAKNEEENIEQCLQLIAPYGFEIIVADTGSTDRTKEIAAKYTNNVVDFEWIKDFSAARNFAASKASNPWVLVLDCDEFITFIDVPEILSLIRKYPDYVGSLENHSVMPGDKSEGTYVTRLIRFYPTEHYHFTGSIHEQLTPLQPRKLISFELPLKVRHTGYVGSAEKMAGKSKRNLDLLMDAHEKAPEDPYHYYNIGQALLLESKYSEACDWYARGMALPVDPGREYVQAMVVSYGQSLLLTERNEQALQFRELYDTYCSQTDFVYLMGRIYLANNMPVRALGEFLKAITLPPGKQQGVNSFLPCYLIAVIYDRMDNRELAIMYYKKSGDFPPALQRLEELS